MTANLSYNLQEVCSLCLSYCHRKPSWVQHQSLHEINWCFTPIPPPKCQSGALVCESCRAQQVAVNRYVGTPDRRQTDRKKMALSQPLESLWQHSDWVTRLPLCRLEPRNLKPWLTAISCHRFYVGIAKSETLASESQPKITLKVSCRANYCILHHPTGSGHWQPIINQPSQVHLERHTSFRTDSWSCKMANVFLDVWLACLQLVANPVYIYKMPVWADLSSDPVQNSVNHQGMGCGLF